VTLKVRFSDFRTITRRETAAPVAEDLALYHRVLALLQPQLAAGRKIRLLGVGVSNFSTTSQPSLFPPEQPERPVDAAVDRVRDKFGEKALRRGRFVTKTLPSRAEREEGE
jgi:DNA polymerase-4